MGKKSILITSVSALSISNGILWSEPFFTQINPWIKFNTDQNVEVNFGFHAVKQVVADPESRRRCHVTSGVQIPSLSWDWWQTFHNAPGET